MNGALTTKTNVSEMAKLIINIFVAFPLGISRKNVNSRIAFPTMKKCKSI